MLFEAETLHLLTEIQFCLCKGHLQLQPRSAPQLILTHGLHTPLWVHIYIYKLFIYFLAQGRLSPRALKKNYNYDCVLMLWAENYSGIKILDKIDFNTLTIIIR